MIRSARITDVDALMEFGQTLYAQSKFQEDLDLFELRKMWVTGITNTAFKVFVAEKDEQIVGVIALVIFPEYGCFTKKVISEYLWAVISPGGSGTGIRLLRRAEKWAAKVTGGDYRLRFSPNNALGNPDPAAVLLERQGFTQVGYVYEKEGGQS